MNRHRNGPLRGIAYGLALSVPLWLVIGILYRLARIVLE
jgi:hypothetical protein